MDEIFSLKRAVVSVNAFWKKKIERAMMLIYLRNFAQIISIGFN